MACALARDYGARIVLLHVKEPIPVAYGEFGAFPMGTEEDEPLRELLLRQCPADPAIPVEYRLAEGDPAAEIVRMAQKIECDLIVMGTHGRTGLGRLLMGSVAEMVLREAPCPVLTVRVPIPEAIPGKEVIQPAHATSG